MLMFIVTNNLRGCYVPAWFSRVGLGHSVTFIKDKHEKNRREMLLAGEVYHTDF